MFLKLCTGSGAALQSSSRKLQPLVHDVQAAGLTECGGQVERPCERALFLEFHSIGLNGFNGV